eukprot:XP_001689721.1 predicted protein [Chlamydomonas reinhardtii]
MIASQACDMEYRTRTWKQHAARTPPDPWKVVSKGSANAFSPANYSTEKKSTQPARACVRANCGGTQRWLDGAVQAVVRRLPKIS